MRHDVRSGVKRCLEGELQRMLDEARLAHVRRDGLRPCELPQFTNAGLDNREPLGEEFRVGHSAGPLLQSPVLAKDRPEVEPLVAGPHLEAYAERRVAVDEEHPVAKDPGPKVDGGTVHRDHLRRAPKEAFDLPFEPKRQGLEGCRRGVAGKDRHVDVAVGARVPPGEAAEEPRGDDVGGGGRGLGEESAQALDGAGAVHVRL